MVTYIQTIRKIVKHILKYILVYTNYISPFFAAFDKFNDLMSHLNTCNCLLEQTYSFYCELCSLTFNNLSEYSAHSAATHDLPKNMPGESATTAVSSQMTILDKIHQRGPKNFKCDICGNFLKKILLLYILISIS